MVALAVADSTAVTATAAAFSTGVAPGGPATTLPARSMVGLEDPWGQALRSSQRVSFASASASASVAGLEVQSPSPKLSALTRVASGLDLRCRGPPAQHQCRSLPAACTLYHTILISFVNEQVMLRCLPPDDTRVFRQHKHMHMHLAAHWISR